LPPGDAQASRIRSPGARRGKGADELRRFVLYEEHPGPGQRRQQAELPSGHDQRLGREARAAPVSTPLSAARIAGHLIRASSSAGLRAASSGAGALSEPRPRDGRVDAVPGAIQRSA
jgi:hypothetical protein